MFLSRKLSEIDINLIITIKYKNIIIIFISTIIGCVIDQSMPLAHAPQNIPIQMQLTKLPNQNGGREIALTFEYLRLLYRFDILIKCISYTSLI